MQRLFKSPLPSNDAKTETKEELITAIVPTGTDFYTLNASEISTALIGIEHFNDANRFFSEGDLLSGRVCAFEAMKEFLYLYVQLMSFINVIAANQSAKDSFIGYRDEIALRYFNATILFLESHSTEEFNNTSLSGKQELLWAAFSCLPKQEPKFDIYNRLSQAMIVAEKKRTRRPSEDFFQDSMVFAKYAVGQAFVENNSFHIYLAERELSFADMLNEAAIALNKKDENRLSNRRAIQVQRYVLSQRTMFKPALELAEITHSVSSKQYGLDSVR